MQRILINRCTQNLLGCVSDVYIVGVGIMNFYLTYMNVTNLEAYSTILGRGTVNKEFGYNKKKSWSTCMNSLVWPLTLYYLQDEEKKINITCYKGKQYHEEYAHLIKIE